MTSATFDTLLQKLDDGLISASADKIVLHANIQAAKILGFASVKELIGKSANDIFEDQPERQEFFYKLIGSGFVKNFILHKSKKDGEQGDVLVTAVVVKDANGQILRFEAILRLAGSSRFVEKQNSNEKERLALVSQNIRDGIWDWNIETDEVYFSVRWKEMLGYKDDELENTLSTWQKLLHPDDSKDAVEYLNNYISQSKNDDNFEYRFRMKHKDGHYVPILSRAFLLKKEAGRSVRMLGTHIDLSEYQKIEDRLKISEGSFKVLFNRMPIGVAIYRAFESGSNFIVNDLNQAGCKMSGIKRDDVLNKKVTDAFPGIQNMGLFDVMQRVWRGGEPEEFLSKLYEDVKISRWFDNYVFKMPSGMVVCVYRDITEEKQKEFDLAKKLGELERMNELMTGRELKMIELKQEIEKLKETK